MLPYPLKNIPIFKKKIWGGRKIEEFFKKNLPINEKIGESWEIADLCEGASSIANGHLQNKTLTEAVKLWGESLIGTKWENKNQFPLLVKLIDAQDDLSVQVHPDAETCIKYFPQHHSKDETWLILDAPQNSAIYYGFKKGIYLEDYENSVKNNDVVEILRKLPIQKGDFIRIQPGFVHAILKGILLLEIQEPSDSTFRIYDYGRLGDDNKPRAIHLQEAKKAMKFDWIEKPLLQPEIINHKWGTQSIIVNCPAYRIEEWNISDTIILNQFSETVRIIFNLGEVLRIESDISSFDLEKGESAVIPAVISQVKLIPENQSKIIVAGAYIEPKSGYSYLV